MAPRAEKRVTPSTQRMRSNVKRSRRQLKSKRAEEKPSWTESLKRQYLEKDMLARGKAVDTRSWAVRQAEAKRNRELAQVKGKFNGRRGVAKPEPTAADDEDDEEFDDPELDAEIDREMAAMTGKGAVATEVQGEIDAEKEKRLNQKQPLDLQVFLKGLPHDVDEVDLAHHLTRFGKVKKVFVVKNTVTGTASGSAFVHFANAEGAKNVLEHAQLNCRESAADLRDEQKTATDGLTRHKAKELLHKLKHQQVVSRDPFIHYGNTRVSVLKPMTRTDTQEFIGAMHKGGKKANKTTTGGDDPRNLYLLREGLIEPGTPAAKNLSAQYLNSLQRDYEERKSQLRNVNVFISKTRLSVRNLPRTTDDKKLKALFLEKAKEFYKNNPQLKDKSEWGKFGPLKQCRVMLDSKGQSKRFAFVELCSHELALYCLRMINNNPEIYGPLNRPVVSFAIEDANAIQRRALRKDAQKRRNERESTEIAATVDLKKEIAQAAQHSFGGSSGGRGGRGGRGSGAGGRGRGGFSAGGGRGRGRGGFAAGGPKRAKAVKNGGSKRGKAPKR